MTLTSTDQNSAKGKHDDLTKKIIGVFYDVYNELGPGLVESVYCEAMRLVFQEAGLAVATEVQIPVRFHGAVIGKFRADLVVNGSVLIELKTCEGLIREHESQVLNYLKATEMEVALLMNFGPAASFKRLVMDNQSKKGRTQSVKSVEIGVKPFADGEARL